MVGVRKVARSGMSPSKSSTVIARRCTCLHTVVHGRIGKEVLGECSLFWFYEEFDIVFFNKNIIFTPKNLNS